MIECLISPALIAEHGISPEEYQQILSILKREPSLVELGIFSVMWSEHASYKNSVKLLKTLPKDGSAMLTKAGEENAGVVDIGQGLAITFKIESHNHPSALEPYHGAATGVGGILRDIFTMGARPIAALNSLRFGNPDNPKVKHLISEVVHGIADYGNCFGVPTVGGEIYFEDSYEGNPLVNAMAVGVLKHGQMAKSAASGVGNAVIIVGAKTGRDGIHGATFASIELSNESEEKRTAVQVGDPFLEKLLLEATLEVIHAGLVVGIQDMGAAGLTCSSSEMAGKGEVGIEIDVALVPQRESGMSPYEIMLSESQERMLVIVEPHNVDKVKDVFAKWDLDAVQIGKVTDDKLLRVFFQKEMVAEIPAETLILGGTAPVYSRESKRPEYLEELLSYDLENLPEPHDYNATFFKMMACANLASRHRVYRQYDHMVQIGSVVEPGSDAAVIRIHDTDMAIALSTDCNGRHCALDPYMGTMAAVAEGARNVACSGAKPLAITNCLNFGNPYKPEAYYFFSEAIRGMSEACKAFETPVTGGNVSFYNENPTGAIYPTPVIGMLGLMQDFSKAMTQSFKHAGDVIMLLGSLSSGIGGSEYLKQEFGIVAGNPPQINLHTEKQLQQLILQLIHEELVNSAHDVSDGGLLVAVAESCFNDSHQHGANLQFSLPHKASHIYFGEAAGRILISANPNNINSIKLLADMYGIECYDVGLINDSNLLSVNDHIKIDINELHHAWWHGLTL
ncbi:MAG: phosphoribosylformylglycinamidine synthase subunit PurL [Candidatus Cloacimonetes bacterium HGW-Cloacimonetes-3]|jgi:phosphoribosylformylglycinamidine synthase|nr:MAG: phosphoribosylformylglycinamidine synthase subunit PurL [Candidatus Cloacimonetes bacterium HGW-Cloacimonetes-3]